MDRFKGHIAPPFQGEAKSISAVAVILASVTQAFNPSPEEVEGIYGTN